MLKSAPHQPLFFSVTAAEVATDGDMAACIAAMAMTSVAAPQPSQDPLERVRWHSPVSAAIQCARSPALPDDGDLGERQEVGGQSVGVRL
jgi:hypothetical protein